MQAAVGTRQWFKCSVRQIVNRLKNRVGEPAPKKEQTSGWKVLLGIALGLGALLVAAVAGIDVPPPGSSVGSGNAGM